MGEGGNEMAEGVGFGTHGTVSVPRFRIERLKPGSATLPLGEHEGESGTGQFDFVGSVNNWQDRCWTSLTTSGLLRPGD